MLERTLTSVDLKSRAAGPIGRQLGWSLEVDGLPHISLDVVSLIEFLGWHSTNILWHEPQFLEQAQLFAAKFKQQMAYLKSVYAGSGG